MVLKLQIEEGSAAVSRFRSITSQLLACMAPNLLLLDLGMAISFMTIALPDLLNASEGLSLNEQEASWFSSISFLSQPLGAVVSGPLVDFFGRKKSNFLVNIPIIFAWLLMYFSWSVASLYAACALLGLSIGIMEAPINAYVGEISEPHLRGFLCTITQFFASLGMFIMFFLGTVVKWREAALICLGAPLAAMLLGLFVVPESPVWLLAKGREKESLQALCTLRGWTVPENVREEFEQLLEYSKQLQQCPICCSQNEKPQECPHKDINFFKRFILKFKYVILCKETLRPLTLTVLYFTFYVMSGLAPVRANMVNVAEAMGMPMDGKTVTLLVGVITLVTTIAVVIFIKILGKRKIAISALFGTAVCCLGLSIYSGIHLDHSVFSYDVTTFPKEKSYVPLVLFFLMTMFTGFGLPWVLLGEVFPYRSRATSQGFAAASNYVVTFIGSKTFIDIENTIRLTGVWAVYAAFGFMGAIYLYFFQPETEGKTLQEIESCFNGELKTFADDPIINSCKRIRSKQKTFVLE